MNGPTDSRLLLFPARVSTAPFFRRSPELVISERTTLHSSTKAGSHLTRRLVLCEVWKVALFAFFLCLRGVLNFLVLARRLSNWLSIFWCISKDTCQKFPFSSLFRYLALIQVQAALCKNPSVADSLKLLRLAQSLSGWLRTEIGGAVKSLNFPVCPWGNSQIWRN